MKYNNGDIVKVHTKEEIYEGILMPRPEIFDENYKVIKLDNGYNIGIENKKITKIEVIKKYEKKKEEGHRMSYKSGLPKISILHTGGTIASRVDYRSGGVVAAFSPEEIVSMFPELAEIANIDSELIANMWSDDLRFSHFKLIAKAIEKKAKEGIDGIIIGIGTDNLAVASAALAFIIQQTPIPIIFTGAQRSSDRGSSDAAMNLICAAEFIAKTDFAGVAVCMHENTDDKTCAILPPAKTRKLHSSRRDAFKPVNDTLIARVNITRVDGNPRKIEFIKESYAKKDKNRKLIINPNMEEKVGLLKITVNMFPKQFEFFKGYKGLVIEGTGLGHTPGHAPNELANIHKKIFPAIKKVIDSGCVLVMTTTCLFGRVEMQVYSKGRDLLKLGIIPGEDMLPETAFVKLAWLLGNYKKEEVKELIGKNLRGEISERVV
ncbi:Glu-tRNA(Gln) amidotransferase subunit GatD [Candidatus Woesearchaeota archaeon]|nr:Glu-tRNA(Gln) amidotransferase subunit GatD [Candidatus Woesearchaeota archaeon]